MPEYAWLTLAALSTHRAEFQFGTGITMPTFRTTKIVDQALVHGPNCRQAAVFRELAAAKRSTNPIGCGGWAKARERPCRLGRSSYV